MKSIRRYLISVLFSAIAIVMFIAMLIAYQRSLQQAERIFESELQMQYQLVNQLLLHFQDDHHAKGSVNQVNGSVERYSSLYQVVDLSGNIILQSGDFGDKTLAKLSVDTNNFNYDGRRWHALVKPAEQLPYWIIVAEQDDLRFQLADAIIVDILKPFLLGLLAIVLLVWMVVRAGFKPVEQLTQAIREKSASDLSAISSDNTPDELQAISVSVNELFKRLTSAFDREKQFTADAAHEMRNPITALKIHIDNLLDESPERSESLLKIKQAIDRLSNLVEQMLVLHRMSPDQYVANFVRIDLLAVAQDVIAELYPDIEKKSQTIELDGVECCINADLFGMEVLIKNLISNASKYSPEHGHIRVHIAADAILTVEDSGPGLPDSEKLRVFDRFYRVGGDRHSSKTLGSGLGLSIVKHIAELHQARIDIKDSQLGGLCVVIHFPVHKQGENISGANR